MVHLFGKSNAVPQGDLKLNAPTWLCRIGVLHDVLGRERVRTGTSRRVDARREAYKGQEPAPGILLSHQPTASTATYYFFNLFNTQSSDLHTRYKTQSLQTNQPTNQQSKCSSPSSPASLLSPLRPHGRLRSPAAARAPPLPLPSPLLRLLLPPLVSLPSLAAIAALAPAALDLAAPAPVPALAALLTSAHPSTLLSVARLMSSASLA